MGAYYAASVVGVHHQHLPQRIGDLAISWSP